MLRRLLQSFVLSPKPDCIIDDLAVFRIPENERLLHPSLPYFPTYPYRESVERIEGKRAVMRPINGHPDLHQYFWFEAGDVIPKECRWVFRGNAALIHPTTMIVFALASGTHDITVRAPVSSMVDGLVVNANWTDPASSVRWVQSPLNLDECRPLLIDAMHRAGPKL